jgi:hypothetical protein
MNAKTILGGIGALALAAGLAACGSTPASPSVAVTAAAPPTASTPTPTPAVTQGCGQSRFCCSQVWCEAEQGEEQGAVIFGVADGGGDAVVAGLADEAH